MISDGLSFGDANLLGEVIQTVGLKVAEATASASAAYLDDERISPDVLFRGIMQVHLLGCTSVAAAAFPDLHHLDLVTWLIEALGEAKAAKHEVTPQ